MQELTDFRVVETILLSPSVFSVSPRATIAVSGRGYGSSGTVHLSGSTVIYYV